MPNNEIQIGYCQCGCGQKTKIARQDNPEHGHIRGQPLRYVLNHSKTAPTIEDRFWQSVSKKDDQSCWEWQGGQSTFGYGKFTYRNTEHLAHRVSWEIHFGPIPEGAFVCHDCPEGDNPRCVNPKHLWLGSNVENTADRQAKDRQAKGIKNGHATLSEDDVRQVRNLQQQGFTHRQIAKLIGCTKSGIHHVLAGNSWKHID